MMAWFVAFIIFLMMGTLIVYLVFLYSSKERADRIEKGGMIPFMDEPLEEKKNTNSNRT